MANVATGQIVHVQAMGYEKAAIVTWVYSADMVNLVVFNDGSHAQGSEGSSEMMTSVNRGKDVAQWHSIDECAQEG